MEIAIHILLLISAVPCLFPTLGKQNVNKGGSHLRQCAPNKMAFLCVAPVTFSEL